jgi:hypothetical protein
MNYDCTTHPILPFITITTKFLSKHCTKRVHDTEMNGYHCFHFTEKTFLRSVDPKQPKMSNIHFDLSLKLSKGEVHDFSGEVQKLSGDVQNDLRRGAHFPLDSLRSGRRRCSLWFRSTSHRLPTPQHRWWMGKLFAGLASATFLDRRKGRFSCTYHHNNERCDITVRHQE